VADKRTNTIEEHIFAARAEFERTEFERTLIRERTRAGIARTTFFRYTRGKPENPGNPTKTCAT
jgi:hypothetical protein